MPRITLNITDFRLLDTIYESERTAVYRAKCNETQQAVIIKVLNMEYPDPEAIARFTGEYDIHRRLKADGVPRVLGLGKSKNSLMMAMEDIGGQSLDNILLERQLTLPEFFSFSIQLTAILEELHRENIVHKDINPANIIWNPETRRIQLIDFGISTELSRENPRVSNPNRLEGSLLYISPEQTGRMNRPMDYRTDLYSLGATFYEILTGTVPFHAGDPMELVHAHIAKRPTPPHDENPELPSTLSSMVLKLMEKRAEDRYQSAYGLKSDLEECLEQFQATGAVSLIDIGRHDISEHFHIPGKLYGRDSERAQLMAGFERACTGKVELMLISGYSGIGKTSLILEIHKPIVLKRGIFISGKCDRLRRNIPYASLVQAFRDLTEQMLTESAEQLSAWQTIILEAVGSRGRVLIDFIPDLEAVIGPQPPVPELPPAESQSRFNMILQDFVTLFADPKHPLVIFLDDLQWIDNATLKLMELLAAGAGHLYLIGAYRSNEVDDTHPLLNTIGNIEKNGTAIRRLSLSPLDPPHIRELVMDTLRCGENDARTLGDWVQRKTGGNAFFINQFLKTLYREGALTFNAGRRRWTWSMEKIQQSGITDNVVELMTHTIKKLPPHVQHTLRIAACFGNRFRLTDLAVVIKKSVRAVIHNLWDAIEEELLLPIGNDYRYARLLKTLDDEKADFIRELEFKFLHDRVQQAAYSLLSEMQRKEINLQIGRLLLENTRQQDGDLEDRIFDIVNHINYSREFVSQTEEMEELVRLNMMAGKKAKASTAYETALKYFTTAFELLPADCWRTGYAVTLPLYMEKAECEYLNGHFGESEKLFEIILDNVKTDLEKIDVYNVKINVLQNLAKYNESVQLAAEAFELMGMKLSLTPGKHLLIKELIKIKLRLRNTKVDDLLRLPPMKAPNIQAIMETLMTVSPSLAFISRELGFYTILKALNLTLKYGNSDHSAYIYVIYGMGLCSGLGDPAAGFKYGELALKCLESSTDKDLICKTHFVFGRSVNHWKRHAKTSLDSFNITFQNGIESGNVIFSAYAAIYFVVIRLVTDAPLADVKKTADKYKKFVERIRYADTLPFFDLPRQMVLCLKGETDGPVDLSDRDFNEGEYIARVMKECNIPFAVFWYYIIKVQLYYLFGKYGEALEMAVEAEKRLDDIQGNAALPEHYFYYSLAITAVYPNLPKPQQKHYRKILERNRGKLKKWSQLCPENFLHKYYLVDAESEGLKKNGEKAAQRYEQAAASAAENGYVRNEAIVNECAARFYLERGLKKVAHAYMKDASFSYRQWGADAKVRWLAEKYQSLLTQTGEKRTVSRATTLDTTTWDTSTGSTGSLDWSTMLKASRTIAGEIRMDKLLERMMRILIENAGAQQGFLLLETDGKWLLEAEACVDRTEITVMQKIPLESCDRISAAIVNYVARLQKNVVLNDAANEGNFTHDPYIIKNKPKSILSLPLVHQGKLSGILYLENNLTTDAFTPDRLEVLTLLSAQVAVSIENARLYKELENHSRSLEQKVDERTRELKEKNAQVMGSIRYAQRIQQAILPLETRMRKKLEHHFVILKPKHMVSGDFYWFSHLGEKRIVAVVDCTGHGVPGAFMSMIGNTLLNQVVNEKHVLDPARILAFLHEGVRDLLKQAKSREKDTMDGMDVCVCVYEPANRRMVFAGAHRPLYVVLNQQPPKLLEFRGDRKSIGGRQKEEKRTFTNHAFDVKPGDMLYLTSDGYVDQNDDQDLRYGSPRFKALLQRIAADELTEQKKILLKALKEHQGHMEQRDDITIVGFRV